MDFAKLPIGFSLALAQNTTALQRFGQLSEPERIRVITQARSARSEGEMHRIVSQIAENTTK